ncbi:ZIP family metal transporter [Candidatus Peregrinibacteria bacterium]|nr:ZIP family metal transporter [Candidatus Peregrinibacteria bacterium]
MSQIWIYTMISVLIVSLISFVGLLIIVFKQKDLKKFLLFMVSFAAGAMLGDVFIHLLPELIESGEFDMFSSVYILGGIILFFIIEKIIHWRHCHLSATKDHIHPLAFMNLVGESVHNFIDGVLIAGSFMLSIPVGIATSIAVILHEIPQEMGDFGILLHSGMKVKKALLLNFLVALTAVLGALSILLIGLDQHQVIGSVIPITIGGFLYIANTDLIPELHKDVKISNSIIQLISFLIGVAIMFAILYLPFHGHAHEDVDAGVNHVHIEESA